MGERSSRRPAALFGIALLALAACRDAGGGGGGFPLSGQPLRFHHRGGPAAHPAAR